MPEDVAFATKPQIALAMIARATATDVPCAWVAADSVYGLGNIEMGLRRAGEGFVLGVNASHRCKSWTGKAEVAGTAEEIADHLDPTLWQRPSAGMGTKGERHYEWADRELADLEADEYAANLTGLLTRGLLIRRSLTPRQAGVAPNRGCQGNLDPALARTPCRTRRVALALGDQ